MEIFQSFIQLYLLFGAINIIHSAGNCYCHEDCDALTNVINKLNQQRIQPSPRKKFLHNETDTSTCKRNTKCCVPGTPTCPNGWIMYEASCFMFNRCPNDCTVGWAKQLCMKEQAQLAKISSAEQAQFFDKSLYVYILFLGGNDQAVEGIWRWPDGSLIEDGYTNWYPGKPDGGRSSQCLYWSIVANKWFDVGCSHVFQAQFMPGYACESSPTYVL